MIVAIAAQVSPDNAALGTILTYAAPAISVAGTAAWVMVAGQLKSLRNQAVLDKTIKRASALQSEIDADPNASQKTKDAARDTIEHLRLLAMTMMKADVAFAEAQLKP